jgi:hypothetical protein
LLSSGGAKGGISVMVTTTNATFVTVALYLLDLCPQGRSMRNHRGMRHAEDHYRSLSRELTLDEWLRRQLPKRYIDNVMRLTSALQ